VDTAGINADLHASAEYRAQLIRVQTQRAVQQALAG
jgi:carbon-monoxide dehydrogenase medium subunit